MKDKRVKTPNKIDENPANTMQLDYAKSMGVELPVDATRSDAQELLARHLDNDEAASSGLISYARAKGMLCSDYIGEKALHNLMFDNLEPKDQAAFFLFCVYKSMHQGVDEDLMSHAQYPLFEAFGEQYSQDVYVMVSLIEYYGEEIVAFGKTGRVLPSGKKKTVYGRSKYTRAYKEAVSYIEEKLS